MYLIVVRCSNKDNRSILRNIECPTRTYFSKEDASDQPPKVDSSDVGNVGGGCGEHGKLEVASKYRKGAITSTSKWKLRTIIYCDFTAVGVSCVAVAVRCLCCPVTCVDVRRAPTKRT